MASQAISANQTVSSIRADTFRSALEQVREADRRDRDGRVARDAALAARLADVLAQNEEDGASSDPALPA
jgi:hypothetical protein